MTRLAILVLAASVACGATLPAPPAVPRPGPPEAAAPPGFPDPVIRRAPAPGVHGPMTVRLKDIAQVQGARENQLLGWGLVVGLNGTGDSSEITSEILRDFLERHRRAIDPDDIEAKNVAVVTVTATLPAFARPGTRIDVLAASVSDASSLQGGVLLQTPLMGADRRVYAVAQGPVSIGGFAAGGAAASIQKGHPTVARIPSGALVEKAVPVTLTTDHTLTICLREPDFTTAARLATAVNERFPGLAQTHDADGTIRVRVPAEARKPGQLIPFIARLEEITVRPDARARVIVNERTGTIVAGAYVRIGQVAITHGSLVFVTKESADVSQPAPFAGGDTVTVPNTQVEVRERDQRMVVIEETLTVSDVARALNALGATPNDIVTIFQAIKRAGALPAELVSM